MLGEYWCRDSRCTIAPVKPSVRTNCANASIKQLYSGGLDASIRWSLAWTTRSAKWFRFLLYITLHSALLRLTRCPPTIGRNAAPHPNIVPTFRILVRTGPPDTKLKASSKVGGILIAPNSACNCAARFDSAARRSAGFWARVDSSSSAHKAPTKMMTTVRTAAAAPPVRHHMHGLWLAQPPPRLQQNK